MKTTRPLRKRLRDGEVLLGSFVKMNDPSSTEIMGMLGFDFVILDNEHVAMNKESIVNVIRAAENVGMEIIIRTVSSSKTEILQFLDAGANGVQVPNVDSSEEAQHVVDSVKYYPIGKRGFAPSHRAAQYSLRDKQEFLTSSNEDTLTVVHCETKACIDHLDEILKVDHIDVVFIGPMDLSQAFGVTGNPQHPEVQNAIRQIEEKVMASGKAIGTVVANETEAAELRRKGYQYIAVSSDQGLIIQSGKRILDNFKANKNQE